MMNPTPELRAAVQRLVEAVASRDAVLVTVQRRDLELLLCVKVHAPLPRPRD